MTMAKLQFFNLAVLLKIKWRNLESALFFDAGKIVEVGKHDELVSLNALK